MSLIEFFNDPKSAVIFYAGIGITILFLIAVTKLIYGPKGVPTVSYTHLTLPTKA